MLWSFYAAAFSELATCRQLGFGEGPIPWRDAVAYAERAGLNREGQRAFGEVIRAMDEAYLRKRAQDLAANRRR